MNNQQSLNQGITIIHKFFTKTADINRYDDIKKDDE